MNCIRYINSIEEFDVLIGQIRERRIPGILGHEPYRHEYYRGHASNGFQLKPGLARAFKNSVEIANVEVSLMQDFSKSMMKHNKGHHLALQDNPVGYQNEWAWLGQAQHYRLPTRMLDWTLQPEVALYFAVEDSLSFGDHDAQFWVFYVPDEILVNEDVKRTYYNMDPGTLNQTFFLNPSFFWSDNFENEIAENRRMRQHGNFSVQGYSFCLIPLEDQAEIIPLLEKYCIPVSDLNRSPQSIAVWQ